MSLQDNPDLKELQLRMFLRSTKILISDKKHKLYDRIFKIQRFMVKYGLMPEDVFDIICSLQESDHFRGPTKDHNPKYRDNVWEFKIRAHEERIQEYGIEEDIYIKLKIVTSSIGKELKLICFGFHEDEQVSLI